MNMANGALNLVSVSTLVSAPVPTPVSTPVERSLVSQDLEKWWDDLGASATATQNIADVEQVWRQLEKSGIESPGQSLDFTKAWIARFNVPRSEQLYITGEARGKIVALLPLKRVKRFGARVLTWFSGSHVGCNAPLIDHDLFKALSVEERQDVWQRMRRAMIDTDLVCLHSIPDIRAGEFFGGLGEAIEVEKLYRSVFENWDECQKTQRTRSRKKHDKQQGTKLRAMGKVTFEELEPGHEKANAALDIMFAQKADRFMQQGIDDPFSCSEVRGFYRDIFHDDNGLNGKLHVLSLDDEIVAVLYNLAHGNMMFALISSMSERVELRPGSPGKQNILNAMRSIFESGFKTCDMGAGFSDEKRHWCNETITLRTHYVPLTTRGAWIAKLHRFKYRLRKAIKDNRRLFDTFKSARSVRSAASRKSKAKA